MASTGRLADRLAVITGASRGIGRSVAKAFAREGAHVILIARLDILVGNAGLLGDVTPLPHLVPEVWQDVMDVNVTANYRLIRSLDPLLRQSDAGRVILVSSGVATNFRPFLGPYSISKAALEAMGKTYAAEMEKTNVRCNMINPGPIRTDMRATFMPGEDPMTLPHPDEVAELFVDLAVPSYAGNGEVVKFVRG
jgi:NAD(P)-dependent dehydrogenase (short-subunit alcohol dehydrogenase family)